MYSKTTPLTAADSLQLLTYRKISNKRPDSQNTYEVHTHTHKITLRTFLYFDALRFLINAECLINAVGFDVCVLIKAGSPITNSIFLDSLSQVNSEKGKKINL